MRQTSSLGCRVRLSSGVLLFLLVAGCGATLAPLLPDEVVDPVDGDRFELLARLVHISDSQIVDEESPARLTFGASYSADAWRPQEAYSIQLLDGIVRTVNKMHVARHRIDFLIQTGDALDNSQLNELRWFITALDGGRIDPLSGIDDRAEGLKPDPLLDPHHPFDAQGLYRNGVHGPLPTVPWYSLLGNHDRFAVGVFPIVTNAVGRRTSPLPLQDRIPFTIPTVLDPTGVLAWAPITPANPGPPPEISLPVVVPSNTARRYITDRDFVDAHLMSSGDPPGHGFSGTNPRQTWYSASPKPGLRLITLNSATPLVEQPGLPYAEGAISMAQALFLRRELTRAQSAGESVIVATHHPSGTLELVYGTALAPRTFRKLLNQFPCVKLHLAGHLHTGTVIDRGGYTEIITGSTLDAPQQGRVVEIWRERDTADAPIVAPTVQLRYWMFSHLENIDPPDDTSADLFLDPLLPMRQIAADLAGAVSP